MLDSGFRRNDRKEHFQTFYEFISLGFSKTILDRRFARYGMLDKKEQGLRVP